MPSVLVIDDDAHLRWFVRDALRAHGFEVAEARNGKEGLRTYQEAPADLVLCDLFMPGRGGLEVISQLRQRCPAVKVVAMCGISSLFPGHFLMLARQLGAVDALQKPFGLVELLAAVKKALSG
jgi:DNA-binding NtrC family response regulator